VEKGWDEFLALPAADLAGGVRSLLTPVDDAELTGDVAEYLNLVNHDELAPGSQGWWDDGCEVHRQAVRALLAQQPPPASNPA
jgi:hypothetical protein